MSKLMLIDAAHAEETRVVVVDGNRIEEFDFESAARKQLRGNIYLAKVTRVEPSLQAAFIEYGGNRHGFLAFNEIHPDYYQIPLADREALMRDLAEDHGDEPEAAPRGGGSDDDEDGEEGSSRGGSSDDDDVMEREVERRRNRLMRKYKIQEVIKRRQIMLVQVVKEERGNKGAALTTYLSLAGRYGVLMPNTARGGGISRKIVAAADRKKLKSTVQSLDVPAGMGLIIRTAGAKRTKSEIQRDYDYLMRTWESIRERTMHSIAPALIYAEEDLVKRAIRDMFDKDLEGLVVEGEQGYKDARDIMRMLMPSQAKKVQLHRDAAPLFVKHKIEDQLSQIYSPTVPLRSGGYLVINQTEALVAIDVNSGRSTRERNIEATALKTNLEAAEEACRQLRLRDLAGLIVIDFIDMDEAKNNRAVEKKLKDGLAVDRARVQMGKISMFGLMEISRQRRRTGVLEGTTHVCEHCGGAGRVRTAESSALAALRAIELESFKGGAGSVTLRVPRAVGLFILNEKRAYLEQLNRQQGLFVTVLIDDEVPHDQHVVERTSHAEDFTPPPMEARAPEPEDEAFDDYEDDEDEDDDVEEAVEENEGGRGRDRHRGAPASEDDDEDEDEAEGEERSAGGHTDDSDQSEGARRRRRRGRRGGRRAREEGQGDAPYVWARMRAPDGDPYVWLDPASVLRGDAPEGEAPARPQPEQQPANDSHRGDGEGRRGRGRNRNRRGRDRGDRRPETAVAETAAPAGVVELTEWPQTLDTPPAIGGGDDIWVELPAKEDAAPSRRTRRRGKPRNDEPTVEAAVAEPVAPEPLAILEAEAEVEPVVEAPKPKSRRKAAPKVEASAPEPVAEIAAPEPVAVEPAAPAEPDPAEITTPPAAPRKGWWKRA